ncbi:MAG: alpha/beta hydrolase [Clostridia bacterium]|nr:alpha/beta hydrolase [Clostridia bacterium]MBR1704775.1 alpha/beta hydrolase [Clostridia bacterium]
MLKKAEVFAFETRPGDPFPNSQYFELGDYKIHYRVDPAEGKQIAKAFLLHGFACNTQFFQEMVDILTKQGITCVRADLPDFGFSTREYKGIRHIAQKDIFATMLNDLDEDGSGWLLFGHSMGGSVSMQMALDEVDKQAAEKKINALILYAPLLMRDLRPAQRKMMMDGPVGKFLDWGLPYFTPYDGLWKFIGYLMTFDKDYVKDMSPHLYCDALQVEHIGSGAAYMTAVATRPDLKDLAKLTLPTQVIFGLKDVFVMPPVALKIWRSMPKQADKTYWVNAAHCFLQNQADRTFAETKKFLQKNGLI